MANVYRLKVTQVEQVCLFELTWGQGQQLTAKLPYPRQLETLYQRWQRNYMGYYQSALRAIAVVSGQLSHPTDWHSQLVGAEAQLLSEFHQWLRSRELFEIRRELGTQSIAKTFSQPTAGPLNTSSNTGPSTANSSTASPTDLLISCDPLSLGRLPWEAWEISAEFGNRLPVRIARLPVTVRSVAATQLRRGKARILVILGDDTGLDFEEELGAIATLHRLATIQTIGWKPNADPSQLKQIICNTIQAKPGWDALLFFGHSNEANVVGGQLSVAPNATLSIKEITPALQQATANGLKFALFNSCKGLDIANSLIDLGLNQVVVMREPIHNQVAQVFLIQFLQSLSQLDDVHTALQKASKFLRSERHLTFPAAHLVPSLFRHREATLFQLRPIGWRAKLRTVWPKAPWQKVALGAIATLSLLSPVTQSLLSARLWTQAIYRDTTQQFPPTSLVSPPPVVLLQIDEKSLQALPSGNPIPMDRGYLANIIDRLTALEAKVIGIDYLLDRPQANNDPQFSQALESAAQQGTSLIFGAILPAGEEVGVREDLASLNWAMQGYTELPRWYLLPPSLTYTCADRCPFTYLLALTQTTRQSALGEAIAPNINSTTNYRKRLLTTLEKQTEQTLDPDLEKLFKLRRSPWTALSRQWRQRWLQPPLDFSIPPSQAYAQLSTHDLLTESEAELRSQFDWPNQTVIIAAAYGEADTGFTRDYTSLPPAIAHWHAKSGSPARYFTGGEANAYAVHHFLQQHYVIPIPTVWMVALSTLLSIPLTLFARRLQTVPQKVGLFSLGVLSLSYGLLSLQLYVAMQLLLPWLLPTAVAWIYALPMVSAPSKNTL